MVHDEVRVFREGIRLDAAVDDVDCLGRPGKGPEHRIGLKQLLLERFQSSVGFQRLLNQPLQLLGQKWVMLRLTLELRIVCRRAIEVGYVRVRLNVFDQRRKNTNRLMMIVRLCVIKTRSGTYSVPRWDTRVTTGGRDLHPGIEFALLGNRRGRHKRVAPDGVSA